METEMGNDKGSFVVYLDIKEIVDELDDGERGSAGFGSTGR